MGKKPKSSRNISTEHTHDFFEESTKDANTCGSLSTLPSESLFVIDKSRDLSVKRKIEKHREKVLRCDSLLRKNPFVQPVSTSIPKKFKEKTKEVQKDKDAIEESKDSISSSGMVDLWDGDDNVMFKTRSKPSLIPAVEVDPPGCSFNPSAESHQPVL